MAMEKERVEETTRKEQGCPKAQNFKITWQGEGQKPSEFEKEEAGQWFP